MKKDEPNYFDLQKSIDALVGKFGLQKTIKVVNCFCNNTALTSNESEKTKLLFVYLISKSVEIFQLDASEFNTSQIKEYKEARMACYYLLKKFTNNSFGIIGEHFGQSKRSVMYHYHKCNEILSIPKFYKEFVQKFNVLEEEIINFLSKLN